MHCLVVFSRQVYIVGHIPPGSDERHIGHMPYGHTSFTEKNNLRYLRLVKKYSEIIQGQFFGHLHSDSFRVVYSDSGKSGLKEQLSPIRFHKIPLTFAQTGKPISWMMIAPSITPRKMSESNNPAMRLYKFDTDTGQVGSMTTRRRRVQLLINQLKPSTLLISAQLSLPP